MLNKYDIILITLIIISTGILTILLAQNQGEKGEILSISIDSKQYSTYDINQNQTIDLNINGKHNKVKIENGKAKMIDADCPDKYCLSQNAISQGHETIVCLPNKVIIELKQKKSTVDTVVG